MRFRPRRGQGQGQKLPLDTVLPSMPKSPTQATNSVPAIWCRSNQPHSDCRGTTPDKGTDVLLPQGHFWLLLHCKIKGWFWCCCTTGQVNSIGLGPPISAMCSRGGVKAGIGCCGDQVTSHPFDDIILTSTAWRILHEEKSLSYARLAALFYELPAEDKRKWQMAGGLEKVQSHEPSGRNRVTENTVPLLLRPWGRLLQSNAMGRTCTEETYN